MASTPAQSRLRPSLGRPRDPALPARRRAQILAAATRVFARRGFAATDLQDVADVLKVGKGTLYRYFPSKVELFQAAVDDVMVRMRATIDQAADEQADPLEKISAAISAYLRFFHDHPSYVELLIQERAAFRDRKKPTYFVYREANAERWRDLYRNLIRQGRIRDIPTDRITDMLGDIIYGTMFTNYIAGRKRSLVEQAAEIVDFVFFGLLTPGERSRRGNPTGGHTS
ncbi:MAG: TetR/AcrR family transcriptional regulator [Planctomycetota bacterium]